MFIHWLEAAFQWQLATFIINKNTAANDKRIYHVGRYIQNFKELRESRNNKQNANWTAVWWRNTITLEWVTAKQQFNALHEVLQQTHSPLICRSTSSLGARCTLHSPAVLQNAQYAQHVSNKLCTAGGGRHRFRTLTWLILLNNGYNNYKITEKLVVAPNCY